MAKTHTGEERKPMHSAFSLQQSTGSRMQLWWNLSSILRSSLTVTLLMSVSLSIPGSVLAPDWWREQYSAIFASALSVMEWENTGQYFINSEVLKKSQ